MRDCSGYPVNRSKRCGVIAESPVLRSKDMPTYTKTKKGHNAPLNSKQFKPALYSLRENKPTVKRARKAPPTTFDTCWL